MQMYGMTGETLGYIGQGSESVELPAWKQDFLSKPSVSVRRGIAWGFNAPYEDTNTLVLTASSGQFVDVRFPKDASTPHEAAEHPSFWAFSGISKTTFYDADKLKHAIDMPYTAHCQFIHDIDSRGPGITDEGDMFLLANGECLEMGMMINPATGKSELYKECWTGVDALPEADSSDNPKACIVALSIGPDSVKGIVIRIGGIVQGITAREGADADMIVEVERWQHMRDGKWLRDTRSSGHFPLEWLDPDIRKEGDTIENRGIIWRIAEVSRK